MSFTTTEFMSKVHSVGSLVSFMTGAYSDKVWFGPYKVIKSFSFQQVCDLYCKDWKPPHYDPDGKPSVSDFIPYLIKNEFIDDVDCAQLYLGDWDFEPAA